MNKTIKIIVSGIIAIITFYFGYFIYGILMYSHSPDWTAYKQNMWIFKDYAKCDIDTFFCSSFVKKRDVYSTYLYKHTYNIVIWEFKDLDVAQLDKVNINENVNLDNVKFFSGEVLNKKSDLEVMIRYGFTFDYTMNVNLDEYSKIVRSFHGSNYKGFYGTINQMSFSNKDGEHQIIFTYTNGETPTVFLLYKGHKSFYVIIINSEKAFDESIIKILNLT